MQENYYRTFYAVETRHWWFAARREIILAVASAFLKPGASILDIGCGTGYFLEKARERFHTAGLDRSPLAVQYCAERGLTDVHEGTAADLARISECRYDGIFFLDVLEHLDDPEAALREARELLTENGRLFVTVPAFMFLWSEHDEFNEHRLRYRAPQLRVLLQRAGFRTEKLSYFNSLMFPAFVAIRLLQRLLRLKSTGLALNPDTGPLNAMMRWTFAREAPWLRRHNFSAGMSIIAVARRSG
jgi:2-polyprenyl-3-methyl-5-hydroxy-6-metoxy-1,4-benzoquinol methylase